MTGRIDKTVFISYRRTNMPWALAIYQNLNAHDYDVFIDYQSINSGDFEQVIIQNVRARAHFVLLLTPSALERCNDPNDWLRREIETAIDNKRNIIPVMLEGFDFGGVNTAKALIGKMTLLKNYNGLRVYSEYFDEGMARLRDRYLNTPTEAVLHPVTEDVEKVTKEQKDAASSRQVNQEALSAQEWFEQGYKYLETKNYDEAIRCFTEAIRINPNDEISYNNRGFAYDSKDDLEAAMKDYNRAIELNPEDYYPYGNRGVARLISHDVNGAIDDFNRWIHLAPDDHLAYANRADAYREQRMFEDALSDLNQAIRLKPDYAEYYYSRGYVRHSKGDLEKAFHDLNESIRLDPEYAEPYAERGSIYYEREEYDAALKDYETYVKMNGIEKKEIEEFIPVVKEKLKET